LRKLTFHTQDFLFELALRYVARFEVSETRLLRYLRLKSSEELPQEWLDYVLGRLKKIGAIDDVRVKENLVRSLERRGKGTRAIQMKLKEWGLGEHAPDLESEILRAQDLASRWRDRGLDEKKISSRLAMRGFNWETISKVGNLRRQNSTASSDD
jgi:SOS response regulatory protein OraA/RecX